MLVIDQSFEIVRCPSYWECMTLIEDAGRTCYKSKPGQYTAGPFVERMVKSGHHSVIEHANATVRIITNRGVTHELVRHRLASYSQESTRYCNYGSDHVTFIRPHKCAESVLGTWDPMDNLWNQNEYETPELIWLVAMHRAEKYYKSLLGAGWKPEDARGVLPNDLKTEIVVTANMREWRHIFKLRGSKAAHPQIRELALEMLEAFWIIWPELFRDIREEYHEDILRLAS